MFYRVAADAVVILHLAFVLFVALGALLALRWRRVLWIQVPAALWGAAIELTGGICPLTPLENHLRSLGGESGYAGGFLDHYLLPMLYPAALTRTTQFFLAAIVVSLNGLIYWVVARRTGPALANTKAGSNHG